MNTWLPVLGQWRRSQDSDSISLADGKCGLPIVTGLESLLTGALQNLKFYTLSSLPLGTLWERLSTRESLVEMVLGVRAVAHCPSADR